jgi:hypothetical protein
MPLRTNLISFSTIGSEFRSWTDQLFNILVKLCLQTQEYLNKCEQFIRYEEIGRLDFNRRTDIYRKKKNVQPRNEEPYTRLHFYKNMNVENLFEATPYNAL